MTERVSGAAPGARMEASVKWYDAAKGFGFLAPGGGLPDIFCHVSALEAVGLDILLDRATVNRRGRAYYEEVRRILLDIRETTERHGDRRRFRGP